MKRKIIGIFIVTLLIGTATLPLVSSADKNDSSQVSDEDCKCETKSFGKGNQLTPLYPEDTSSKPITMDPPDYFSWMDYEGQDWTTPAKDQHDPKWCGSCWIFASVGILESVINIKEGSAVIDPDLSEQYVLSCLPEAGWGCDGGFPYDVFSYIMDNSSSGNNCNGIIWETCFPYQADDNIPCDDKCQDWEDYLVPISDHGYWITNESIQSIEEIKTQIMLGGPVVASMIWNLDFWYWGMDHHDPNDYFSYQDEYGDDHDIVVVGWKDDPLIPNGGYWIIKNCLGTDFGYDGFFNMEYGLLGGLWLDDDPDTTYIVWVDYDPDSFCWPDESDPPNAPTIDGPGRGSAGTSYQYTFTSTDPDGNDVSYYIKWGDGDVTDWTAFQASGPPGYSRSHTWDEQDEYTIEAKAKDICGAESDWAELVVTMPRNRATYYSLFLRMLEQFPLLHRLLYLIRV